MAILPSRLAQATHKAAARMFVPEPLLSRSRSPEYRVLLDHFVTWRWLYVLIVPVLTIFGLQVFWDIELPGWTFAAPPLFLLLFALPGIAKPGLDRIQQFIRYWIACFMLGEVFVASLLSVLDVFDRATDRQWREFFIHAGFATDATFLLPSQLVLLALAACVAVLLMSVPRLRMDRVRLAGLLLVFGIASVTVCLPTQLVLAEHNNHEFQYGVGPALTGLCFGEVTIAWSLSALLLLVRKRGWVYSPIPPAAESPQVEYIKSASTLATTALVVAFFGFNTCLSYALNLNRFIGLREAMAMDLIADATKADPILQETIVQRARESSVSSDPADATHQDVAKFLAHPPAAAAISDKPVWLQDFVADSPEFQFPGFVNTGASGVLFRVQVKELDLPDPWISRPVFSLPKDLQQQHVLAEGGHCAADLNEKTTYFKVYRDCEKQITNQAVRFPLIDTELPLRYIVVASFIAIAGCIAVLSDRLKLILNTPPSTKAEPWILLDASTAIGKALANAWIVALAATPWLLIAASDGIFALQVRMEGSVIRPLHDGLSMVLFVIGLVAAAILSIRLVQQLLLLRHIRNATPAAVG